MKIPSNIYDCPVIVQAYFRNEYRDKIPTKQAYFPKLRDAHDFIIETSTLSLGSDSQAYVVAKALGMSDEEIDEYLQSDMDFRRTHDVLKKLRGEVKDISDGIKYFCEDNGIQLPCGVSVSFLIKGEPIRSFSLTYIPSLKKLANNKKIL